MLICQLLVFEFLGLVMLSFGSGDITPVSMCRQAGPMPGWLLHKVLWGHRCPVLAKSDHPISLSTLLLQFSVKTTLLFFHPGRIDGLQ